MTAPADRPLEALSVEVSISINRPAELVWELVTAVDRIGEFSPECRNAEWLDVTEPKEGARFSGTNSRDWGEWSRVCTVTLCEQPRVFGWVVGESDDPTAWCYELAPDGHGTRLVERCHIGSAGHARLIAVNPEAGDKLVAWRLNDLRSGMETTLARMKAVLEADSP
jgi:uncharacterized protein YndB with AHSA1/START domain